MKNILSSIIVLIAIAGCNNSTAENTAAANYEPSDAARPVVSYVPTLPSFNMLGGSGQVTDLSQLKGKKVFVNLWATWCPPCRAEIPSIQQLYAKADKSKTVFVMLSLDNDFETARKFAAKMKMNLPVYYPAGNLPELFNVQGIPVTYIFNEKGELIHRQDGAADYSTQYYIDLLNQ
ncbi:MAG: TlpA family protein disulfide reductase [Chitinophagaceae bacterium]|nr:TlpA family protein disulfide reductase [Chitinophagaceae bacterium]